MIMRTIKTVNIRDFEKSGIKNKNYSGDYIVKPEIKIESERLSAEEYIDF